MACNSVLATDNETAPFVCEMFRIFHIPTGRRWPIPQAKSEGCSLCEGEEMQRALLSYRNELSGLELMTYYKAVSDKVDLHYLITVNDCCVPHLRDSNLKYFLGDEDLSWPAVAAIIFTVLRLAVVRIESCNADVCILKVIETLSDYFREKLRLIKIVELGGWKGFCDALKAEGESRIDIMPYVRRFEARWRAVIPVPGN